MRSTSFTVFPWLLSLSPCTLAGWPAELLLTCMSSHALVSPVQAQESVAVTPAEHLEEKSIATSLNADLYEGMVLGQTVTVAGQDFYQGFAMLWRDKAPGDRSLLVIRERPSARAGSLIWIEHRGRRLLQLTLPNSRSMIRRLCEQAVEDIWQRLLETELDAKLNSDMDLARDEL